MRARAIMGSALLLALASGCMTPRAIGHFGEGAFYLTRGHYRVRYVSGEEQRLLPPDWTLESYLFDEQGHPIEGRSDPSFVSGYDGAALVPDGRSRPFTAERFDLWFRREDGRSAIWARTVPLGPRWSGLEPVHVAHAGVYGRDGRWGPVPDLIGGGALIHRVVEERPARVDGRPAYAMTFDLAPNIEQPEPARITFVVVAPPEVLFIERRARVRVRAAIVFGCSSPSEQHDEVVAELESLVRRVDLAP